MRRYLISYQYTDTVGFGFGNIEAQLPHVSMESIRDAESRLKKNNPTWTGVVILNVIALEV